MEYLEVEEAIKRPGLRLVLTAGVPGPWGESAKYILRVKGIPYAPVRQLGGLPNDALQRWTGMDNAPIAVYENERPRAGWVEILLLAERLAPQPSLVPAEARARALLFGLAHEICGEQGLGWTRRLTMVHEMLSADPPLPEPVRQIAETLGRKYGYSPEAAAGANERVAGILAMLTAQLREQSARGSRYFSVSGCPPSTCTGRPSPTWSIRCRRRSAGCPGRCAAPIRFATRGRRRRSIRRCSSTASSSSASTWTCRSTSDQSEAGPIELSNGGNRMAQSRTFEMSLLEGEWPGEIRGHHWINGPGRKLPWQKHSIFAPGVLQRLDLQPRADGRLLWHWRESHAYDVEAALAHLDVFEDPRAFHVLGGPLLTGVNNSFFLIDDRVFLTADFNRPWEIDPESMRLKTPVGAVAEWGGSARLSMLSPSVPTTAHPFYDRREGILYDYTSKPAPANGTSLSRFQHQLFLATWDGSGPVRRWEVPGAGLSQYVHEIAGTRNFVLLLESSSFQIETGIAWFGLPKLEPHLPVSNLYVVRKSDLVEANRVRGVPFRKIEVPVEAFHVLADYEDDGQCVDLWLAHGNGLDFLVTNGPADVHWKTGKPFERWQLDRFIHADYAPIGRYRVDVDRERVVESHRVIDYDRWWGAGVWSWDPRPANRRTARSTSAGSATTPIWSAAG